MTSGSLVSWRFSNDITTHLSCNHANCFNDGHLEVCSCSGLVHGHPVFKMTKAGEKSSGLKPWEFGAHAISVLLPDKLISEQFLQPIQPRWFWHGVCVCVELLLLAGTTAVSCGFLRSPCNGLRNSQYTCTTNWSLLQHSSSSMKNGQVIPL